MRSSLRTIIAIAGAFASLSLSGKAQADESEQSDYVLLSNYSGFRGYIGMPIFGNDPQGSTSTSSKAVIEPIEGFQPKALSVKQISDLFAKLCLSNPFDRPAYDAARNSSALEFRSLSRVLPISSKKRILRSSYPIPSVQFQQEHSDYGIASLWSGEGINGLTGRQLISYFGNRLTASWISEKEFYFLPQPQCNLTVRVSGLASSQTLFDGVQSVAAGFTEIRRVEKPKFAGAVWTKPFESGRVARLSVYANGFRNDAQTVHLTLQLLPAGEIK